MTAAAHAPAVAAGLPAAGIPVHRADIAIVGGGLAGSTAAAMLARKGLSVVLVDPHAVYPPDLRCEKLSGPQVEIFRRTGLAELVLPACTRYAGFWVGRFGRVIDKRPEVQYGVRYETLVNRMRAVLGDTTFLAAKVMAIRNHDGLPALALSSGDSVQARLVVVANGLNTALRRSIGIEHDAVSKCHCVTLAFDVAPVGRSGFAFPALTYAAERARDRVAYITLFPIGDTMRANLMVYRALDDPLLKAMRERPDEALRTLLPRLANITGRMQVAGSVTIRPADLSVSRAHLQPGIVLVGDAFATSCPAAGTGTDKVFTDVERLCNVHVPRWMQTDGMGTDKIAAFYADPAKVACDRFSYEKAFKLRALSTDDSAAGRARRWSRFLARVAIGSTREAVARMRAAT